MANKPECSLLLITLLVLVVLQGSHGSRPGSADQTQRLKGLLRAKKSRARQQWMDDGETWRDSISAHYVDGEDGGDDGNKKDDLIEGGLPGQPRSAAVEFKQYGGYVTVHKAKGRSLFYYFAEASEDPSSKPLVLWLNGGPGCSSLGVGAFAELGPFGVNPDGQSLYKRPYAWNRVANTLFLESPAGVGYSFSNTTADYNTTGDRRTASDAYTFLRRWLQRFPEYQGRDFYITGESYAGYYVPELAYTILEKNKKQRSSNIIPLKGILVGNGIMNDVTDSLGVFDYMWSHSLISDETHRALTKHCINYSAPLCETLDDRVTYEVGNIDFYSIYTRTCPSSSSNSSRSWLLSRRPSPKNKVRGYDPCESYYIYAYLNLPYVQAALHANVTRLPYPWDVCSDVISSAGWTDSPSSMFPIYRRLISSGLRIFLYSGDTDAVVPVTSTRYSLSALNLKIKRPWKPWYDQAKQVGGYRVDYEGLTFTTVRGAGHEVPLFQPSRSLDLLRLFLEEN